MSLIFETNNAFKCYLASLAPEEAALNVYEGMTSGDRTNMGWDLMKEYYGDDWKCPPEHIAPLILAIVYLLKKKVKESAS